MDTVQACPKDLPMTEPQPATAPKSRRAPKGEKRREELLDAALQVFSLEGYSGASMAQVAAIVTRHLVLTEDDLAGYDADPEGFVHQESVARREPNSQLPGPAHISLLRRRLSAFSRQISRDTDCLRKSAERCLCAPMDRYGLYRETWVRAGHLHTHAAAYREAPSGIGHVRTIDICTMHRPRLASSPPPAWTPSPTRSTGCRRAPRNSASRSDAGCRGVREVAAREARARAPARLLPAPRAAVRAEGY